MGPTHEAIIEIRGKNLTAQAFDKIRADLRGMGAEARDVGGSFTKAFATIAGGVGVGNLLSSAFMSTLNVMSRVPGQLIEISKRGNDVGDVRGAFESMTGGVEEARDVLESLRSSFGGTVTDYDLMRSANEVLQRGVRVSATEFATLADGARVLGESLGDPKGKLDGMLSAIAKGNERELKQLGVNLGNLERNTIAYAASIGREVSQLNDSQKQRAVLNALLLESRDLVRQNGRVTNDYADNLDAMAVGWQNLQDQIGEAIATNPVLGRTLDAVGDAVAGAFGSDSQGLVVGFGQVIGRATIITAKGVKGVAEALATLSELAPHGPGLTDPSRLPAREGRHRGHLASARQANQATEWAELRRQPGGTSGP